MMTREVITADKDQASFSSSICHPVLKTPELISLILSHLHRPAGCNEEWTPIGDCPSVIRSTLASCIRVCSSWMNLAIAELWGHHAGTREFLSLVGEIGSEDDDMDISVSGSALLLADF